MAGSGRGKLGTAVVRPLRMTAVVVGLTLAAPARAEVTVFQQGLAPSAEYRGCVDTST